MERRNHVDTSDKNILHIGGGSNGDFIIYKNAQSNTNPMENEPVDFSTEFKVFMTDKQTRKNNQENRVLHFWFHDLQRHEYMNDTNEFMKLLLKSNQFPRG